MSKELTPEQAAKRIAELEAANKTLAADNENLKANETGLQGIVEDLSAQNRALTATKGNPNPTVNLRGGRIAQLNHGLTVKGKRLTTAEIAQDQELCEQLLAKGSTAITLINA
jgi:hypothetical protein